MIAATVVPPTSILEIGAAKFATAMAKRRERRAGRPGALSFIGEMLGTLAALTCLVIAAFALTFAAGMAAAGVALLLLDFKVTVVRRARAAQHPPGRQP